MHQTIKLEKIGITEILHIIRFKTSKIKINPPTLIIHTHSPHLSYKSYNTLTHPFLPDILCVLNTHFKVCHTQNSNPLKKLPSELKPPAPKAHTKRGIALTIKVLNNISPKAKWLNNDITINDKSYCTHQYSMENKVN